MSSKQRRDVSSPHRNVRFQCHDIASQRHDVTTSLNCRNRQHHDVASQRRDVTENREVMGKWFLF